MENLTYGILISIVGYSVTLITLALLYYAFRFLPKLLHLQVRKERRLCLALAHGGLNQQNGRPFQVGHSINNCLLQRSRG